MIILSPSRYMCDYYPSMSLEAVISAIADRIGEYCISHTAHLTLKDLSLIDENGEVNKLGKQVLATQLHERFHRGIDGVRLIKPAKRKKGEK